MLIGEKKISLFKKKRATQSSIPKISFIYLFIIFYINVNVRISLHAFRLISQALKLTTM